MLVRQSSEFTSSRLPSDKRARKYESALNRLLFIRWALTLLIVVIYLVSGLSVQLANGLRAVFDSIWVVNGLYVLITVFGVAALMFPVDLYDEYVIENAFGRSKQTMGEWFFSYLKGLLWELIIAVVFFEVLYVLLDRSPQTWWFWTALFYIAAGVVFTTLAPTFILPFFVKTDPIREASWLPHLRHLLQKAGLSEANLFEWDLADHSHEENVIVIGVGKSRRILIDQSILRSHTDEEIIALVAHELGHYKNGDIWRAILVEGTVALFGFYLAHKVLHRLTPVFGFAAPSDISTFPILVVSLFILSLVVMPAINVTSRQREYAADAFAIRLLGRADSLISAIQKADEQNWSDPHPNPVLEALLHSHPSTHRRIDHARRIEAMLRETS